MRRFINPLLLWMAHANHADLIRQIQYLKVENEILRGRLPKRIVPTPQERERLVRHARHIGPALRHLVTIVHYITIYRWIQGGRQPVKNKRPPGRPRTPAEIEAWVVRIARETGWGYTRVLGELKKLGIRTVSRSTVVNILKRHGLDPAPERRKATWDQFIKQHAHSLWACDLVQRRIMSSPLHKRGGGWRWGLRDAYVMILINVQSRRAWISESTRYPSDAWTAQQAALFMRETAHADESQRSAVVIHDRDTCFGAEFKACLSERGALPVRTQIRSPNMNAYAERFIQTLQQECLDHFIIFGTAHLDYLLREFLAHYHVERPHQSIGNMPPISTGPPLPPSTSSDVIHCHSRLGGLLRHYERQAA
jgi:putative transposase